MTCRKVASGKYRLEISGSSRFRHDTQREQWYSRLERFTALGGSVRPTVIIAAITSRPKKGKLPTHFCLDGIAGLPADSIILFEQIRTIDKKRLKERMAQLDEQSMEEITSPLLISIGVKNVQKADRRAENV